jgi:hexosaminidase
MTAVDELILLPRPRCFHATNASLPAQGYRLRIAPEGVRIEAADAAGEFYARMTMRQIERQCGGKLPACTIEDWPDFPSRGVLLDISRDKVPTMETLFGLVNELAEWKINHLELYTEHTFAYRNHREVWKDASPMTGEEIERLNAYCRERFIELVPNQQSFGHFERWLKHAKYRELAAVERATCLDPRHPRSLALLAELYGELLPHFTSRKFNVNCDETAGIEGRVYLDFLRKIHELVKRRGRTMHFWADIVLRHPELIGELPDDVVLLAWGYEAEHTFTDPGRPFFVCPGTSSWNSIAGRTENCLANQRNAATAGLQHGAIGYLNTDWGDNGHWQYLPVSYLGFAAGAALSWCHAANGDRDFVDALDVHVFRDSARVMGRLAYDLGNAYRCVELPVPNGTALFHLLRQSRTHRVFGAVSQENLQKTREYVRDVMRPLAGARMQRADAALIQAEFANAARMLTLACDRGCADSDAGGLAEEMRAILAEHRRLWLARNREGGLADSSVCSFG